MNLKERLGVMALLGERLGQVDEYRDAVIKRSHYNNLWFTPENVNRSITSIEKAFLDPEKLENWANSYDLEDAPSDLKVAIVMAGNIPLVGFHDLLCVFIAGHRAKIKVSDKDKYLVPEILRTLKLIDPRTEHFFEVCERLKDYDAVIATGSNNTARYFEQYFGKYPNIIRKNRNSVAIVTGNETEEELKSLGKDVFSYFGLGCRNVSKLYLPEGYDRTIIMAALDNYKDIAMHSKYKNNYDYNLAIFMLNKENYLVNECLILKEDASLQSRISSVHFEYYKEEAELEKHLNETADEIQCIIASKKIGNVETLPFGEAQNPELSDYADGVDSLDFLSKLNKRASN